MRSRQSRYRYGLGDFESAVAGRAGRCSGRHLQVLDGAMRARANIVVLTELSLCARIGRRTMARREALGVVEAHDV